MRVTKVAIVDDHELFRKGVALTLNSVNNISVVGEAANGKECLKLVEKKHPDIVLMDIKMPFMDGVETTKILMESFPDIKVIALTMFGDEIYLENMVGAGVFGFVLKNTNASNLKRAIQIIADGQPYYSEELLPFFTKKYLRKANTTEVDTLSKREREVLQLIGQGLTNQEIGETLFISHKTVANHRANLMSKTGSKNTVTLLSFAIKNKLIEI